MRWLTYRLLFRPPSLIYKMAKVHTNCRNNTYPNSNGIKRFSVPDEFVHWSVPFAGYSPATYTANYICGQPWADPDISMEFQPQWNQLDGDVNRVSFNGEYKIENGYPLNPIGRTGLRGRGKLGRWGPNHAADPLVTRWKRDTAGTIVQDDRTKKNILQMVVIKRSDNEMWAIPGGMVDPGEKVSTTVKREFMEEALNNFENQAIVDAFFSHGVEIYKGYVDDYRNTDNAWIETVAFNFHDKDGSQLGMFNFAAGSDATSVKWLDLKKDLRLHANHIEIVEQVVRLLDAHW